MPPPIDPEKRAAILQAIRAGELSRAAIARQYGVSRASVTNIAQAAGEADAFDRSRTKKATEARQADLKALRAATSLRMLRKANELLDQMDEPHLVFSFGGRENSYNEHVLERPPSADLRNLMTSAAVAVDKHAVLARMDTTDGADQAKSMLGQLGEALQLAADQINATPAGEDS